MVQAVAIDPRRVESLGPAERLVQALITHGDHLVHHRPGVVVEDASSPLGVRWYPATVRDGVVFRLGKQGKKTVEHRVGPLADVDYRAPGFFEEAAVWMYRQIAEVWKLDNEFVARWASWAFAQEHRDLKVALTAFLLVQPRAGDPVREHGEVLFHDDDHRSVGEAMCLLRRKRRDLSPKMLLRVGDLLKLEGVAAINRELGFGRSARRPPMGRYAKVVTKWLEHRERNERMLEGLVRAGYRRTVMALARRVGYRPLSPRFFELLRWKQKQAADGRRDVAIGVALSEAPSFEGLTEAQICARVVAERPAFKRLVGMVPQELGLTRAVVAAAVEAGCLTDADLVIYTPTLEELGLLSHGPVAERWLEATTRVEDQRAAHVAERVKSKEVATRLEDAADAALQEAVAEVTRALRVYVAVDVSGSMEGAIEQAKAYLAKFLQGFPLERTHVAVFNTKAREVTIPHASARGVAHAFAGFSAGGGTAHGAAFTSVFAKHPPAADEDALVLFVGDQQEAGIFEYAVTSSGVKPVAFGFLEVPGRMGRAYRCVEDTAAALGVPCFAIDADMFGDAYAVGRTLRHLVASTPVRAGGAKRVSLVETILETRLLEKPAWA